MKIYIGFSTAISKTDLVSGLIRTIEGTKYSHVYLKFYIPEYDEWLIYQASNNMIHLLREERFLAKNKVIEEYEFEIPDEDFVSFMKNALKKSGIPYAWFQIIGMFATRLIKLWFNRKVKNPLGDGIRSQVCSELVYHDLKKYIDFNGFEPEWDGPKELNKYIKEHGKLVDK